MRDFHHRGTECTEVVAVVSRDAGHLVFSKRLQQLSRIYSTAEGAEDAEEIQGGAWRGLDGSCSVCRFDV